MMQLALAKPVMSISDIVQRSAKYVRSCGHTIIKYIRGGSCLGLLQLRMQEQDILTLTKRLSSWLTCSCATPMKTNTLIVSQLLPVLFHVTTH